MYPSSSDNAGARASVLTSSGFPAPSIDARSDHDVEVPEEQVPDVRMTANISHRLFISHFLSTWNSRVFEFGAVLFIAAIYPGTLLPASLYALFRGCSAVCFAPAVGRYVDRGNRLQVVRVSIVAQRAVVAVSCIGFLLLIKIQDLGAWQKKLIAAVIVISACVEKLCSIMNLVAVERDWVVVIAGHDDSGLQALNSRMRRIDLICKLVGPLAISVIDGISTFVAIWIVLGLNVTSVFVEYFAIAKVYTTVTALQISRVPDPDALESPPIASPSRRRYFAVALTWIRSLQKPLVLYIRNPAFLPSMSLSLLYLTVLSFAAQMVTYLLSAGFTSTQVGIIRTASVVFEISATWLAPMAMRRIGPIRAGLWFINWQCLCVAVAGGVFWTIESPSLSALSLIVGVILSRVGLWGFDLCTQLLVQERVHSESRGSFSSVEASFQNLFELFSFASTIVFSRPEQFRYPVLISSGTIFLSGALYAAFVRRNRGHLLHISSCIKSQERKQSGYRIFDDPRERLLPARDQVRRFGGTF